MKRFGGMNKIIRLKMVKAGFIPAFVFHSSQPVLKKFFKRIPIYQNINLSRFII